MVCQSWQKITKCRLGVPRSLSPAHKSWGGERRGLRVKKKTKGRWVDCNAIISHLLIDITDDGIFQWMGVPHSLSQAHKSQRRERSWEGAEKENEGGLQQRKRGKIKKPKWEYKQDQPKKARAWSWERDSLLRFTIWEVIYCPYKAWKLCHIFVFFAAVFGNLEAWKDKKWNIILKYISATV